MNPIINYENLRSFAYSNDLICKQPVKGIVVTFFGLGFSSMFDEDDDFSKRLAGEGILHIIPYYNPWAWMNRQTVQFVDEIISVLIQKYGLASDTPVTVNGGSMGGHASLVFSAYSTHNIRACVVNCPVCDLKYHYTERADLPRTLYSAFGTYEGSMDEALESASPVHIAKKLPKIPYYLFHCDDDLAVNREKHSDVFYHTVKDDLQIEYYPHAGNGHCNLSEEMREVYNRKIIDSIIQN